MNLWKSAGRSDRKLFLAAVLMLSASVGLLSARQAPNSKEAESDEEFFRFMDVAAEVYTQIKGKYVEDVDSREILEAGINGMFSVLDDHSSYLDPDFLSDLEKDTGKEYGGLGIHITVRQGLLTVISPMPGSPAARAGIQPWDRIVEIDGESSQGMTSRDAVERMTGPPNTKVRIKVWREGLTDPIEMELTRSAIRIESVFHKMLDDETGYVRISKFAENTSTDLRRALLDLRGRGMKSVIVDLRFNTGGLLREAIDISNMFVDKGKTIVSTRGRMRNQNHDYSAQEDSIIHMPTFVLVNGSSASASEIVAGALQDHHLALVVGPAGMNTYGKGSVQTVESLDHSMINDANGNPKQSAMKITTARYYTPSGRTIHQVGVMPDIGVPIPRGHEMELLEQGMLGDAVNPRFDPEREPASPKPGEPFYKHAVKPELKNKEFRDIVLDEALKQIKLYKQLLPGGEEKEAGSIALGQ